MFTAIFQKPASMVIESAPEGSTLHCLHLEGSSSERLSLYLTFDELQDLCDVLKAWNASRSLFA